MTRWEYRIVSLPAFDSVTTAEPHAAGIDVLNRNGAAGWEAIGMITLADGSVAVLTKRPNTDGHEARRGRPSRSDPGRRGA